MNKKDHLLTTVFISIFGMICFLQFIMTFAPLVFDTRTYIKEWSIFWGASFIIVLLIVKARVTQRPGKKPKQEK